MKFLDLEQTIRQYIGPLKKTGKGWETRNCMMCTSRGETVDTRGRFGIKFSDNNSVGIHCFNCKFETGHTDGHLFSKKFIQFLETIGVPKNDIKILNFASYKNDYSIAQKHGLVNISDVYGKWKKVSFPPNTKSISEWANENCTDRNFLKVIDYLIRRKIYDFNEIFWTPTTEHFFNKRAIFPYYWRNNLVGYTGRFFSDATPSKKIPKYYSLQPENFIYNLDHQRADRKYLIIVEGIIDAFFVDGIAIIGNEVSKEQASIINSLGKDVIVCPDRDEAGSELIKVALRESWPVSFPMWDEDIKDVGKAVTRYGRIFTLQSIIEGVEVNQTKINLRMKMRSARTINV